jgi:short-subunit dehydrogenase
MARQQAAPRSILITGASSGIGAALARAYAGPGIHLALTGRDGTRLAAVVEGCRAKGTKVLAETVDVADRAAMARFVAAAEKVAPLDLVIANAGISAGTGGGGESEGQCRDIFAVNLAGILNTVWPALGPMRMRRRGQVAIMSSLAGFRGLPSAPAYAASKAAVKAWGEGLRGWLAGEGVRVSVICPGFVESRITAQNAFPMPFLMTAERAAGIIRRGLERDSPRIAFPWPMHFAMWLMAVLPAAVTDRLLARLPRKG